MKLNQLHYNQLHNNKSLQVGFTNNLLPHTLECNKAVLYPILASPTNEPSRSHCKIKAICLPNCAAIHPSSLKSPKVP